MMNKREKTMKNDEHERRNNEKTMKHDEKERKKQ
jgi:hypothetical protein